MFVGEGGGEDNGEGRLKEEKILGVVKELGLSCEV